MDANTTDQRPSRHVEITRGSWAGYKATVIEQDGHRVHVRLDHSGGYHWFDVAQVRHLAY